MKANNTSLYNRIDNAIMKVLRVVSYGAVIFLLLIMLMAFFNVIGEKLGKADIGMFKAIPNSNYWIQYWHIPTVFLTIGYVTLSSGHTKIDFITNHYPKAMKITAGILANLLSAAITGFIAWRGWSVLLTEQVIYGSTINGLSDGFPEWPFGISYCLGMTLTSVAFLWAVIRVLTNHSVVSVSRRDAEEDASDPMK